MDKRVCVNKIENYDKDILYKVIKDNLSFLGFDSETFKDKKVVIKPNLVTKKSPDKAATTHPVILETVTDILKEYDCHIIIAESPPGIYNKNNLKESYKAAGYSDIDSELFNYDTTVVKAENKEGKLFHNFEIIKPLYDADIIINLSKLKTHSLTKMTANVKNFFGSIPGTKKAQLHSRFSDVDNFCEMLVDLCLYFYNNKTIINICDAILAMQGEGPGTGDARKLNTLLMSTDPFCLDLACTKLINYKNVKTVEISQERSLCPDSYDDLEYYGNQLDTVNDFKEPKSQSLSRAISLIPDIIKANPVVIKERCVGCGICVNNCPQKTIELKNNKARINHMNCIRCYCCQELCPNKAVVIRKGF